MTPTRSKWLAAALSGLVAACTFSPSGDDEARVDGDELGTTGDDILASDVSQALTSLPSLELVALGKGGVPAFLRGNLGKGGGTEQGMSQALSQLAPAFRLKPANLKLSAMDQDELGLTHARYAQTKNGLRVVGGDLVLHMNGLGTVYAANGEARDGVELTATPAINSDAAVTAATASRPTVQATQSSLVYLLPQESSALHLAYEVDLQGEENEMPVHDLVYVDALNGAVLERHPLIHTALNRVIYDAKNSSATPGTKVRSEGGAATGDAIVNANYDVLGDVYNYYKTIHGRDSYDNAGATLTSTVHYSKNYVNAYWNGKQMVYGDGKLPQADNLGKSLDVTGHELTHAVTERSSNLTYSGQSGGINEAMSDIFGESIEAWVHGNGDDNYTDASTFIVGDDIWTPSTPGDGLRYMDNPTKDGASRDYYPEYKSSDDVHYSSGIPNLAWALLVKGGKHPRNKTSIVVPAIGKAKATKIFYRANTKYLTASSNFQALRNAAYQSALDLYGQDTANAVTASFDALGVPGSPTGGGNGGGTDGGTTGGTDAGSADDVLKNNVPVGNLSGAKSSETVFRVEVPAGSTSLTVRITGSTSATNDADLYVNQGSKPTTTVYKCRPYRTGSNETCTLASPGAGTWYVMLRGYSAYSGVTLTASY